MKDDEQIQLHVDAAGGAETPQADNAAFTHLGKETDNLPLHGNANGEERERN